MIASCLCPTYNRAPDHLHLLGEAVESFIRQRLPAGVEAELLILNDAPTQRLTCGAPGVRIVNATARYATLGEKRNALVELALGDVLLPWDDDDISLPDRIAQAVTMLDSFPGYWKPPQVWFLDGNGLHWQHAVGVRHHASAYTRAAWKAVGGYPAVSGNEDAIMDQRLGGDRLPRFPDGIPPAEWQYIYRFSVSPCHISAKLDPGGIGHEQHYREIGERSIVAGTFDVKPHWKEDYQLLVENELKRASISS